MSQGRAGGGRFSGGSFTYFDHDKVVPLLDKFSGVTFSLDGATEKTHDRVRGKGSFRNLMRAVSVCMLKDIPFTFNTLISSNNCDELFEIA